MVDAYGWNLNRVTARPFTSIYKSIPNDSENLSSQFMLQTWQNLINIFCNHAGFSTLPAPNTGFFYIWPFSIQRNCPDRTGLNTYPATGAEGKPDELFCSLLKKVNSFFLCFRAYKQVSVRKKLYSPCSGFYH